MSNLGQKFEIRTENTDEYGELFNQHLAAELTKNTNAILGALVEDENTILYEMMNATKNCGLGIFLEDIDDIQKDALMAHILDPQNKRLSNMLLTITDEEAEKRSLFSVERDTFMELKSLALDPQACVTNVQSSFKHII